MAADAGATVAALGDARAVFRQRIGASGGGATAPGRQRLKNGGEPVAIWHVIPEGTAVPAHYASGALEATPNNLPLQLTSFIGREGELADVAKLLAQSRLLTLLGFGGIGK